MLALELLAAALFICSSGIFFSEKFRKNLFLVSCAGLIALVSTVLLVREFFSFASAPVSVASEPQSAPPPDPYNQRPKRRLEEDSTFRDCPDCPEMVVVETSPSYKEPIFGFDKLFPTLKERPSIAHIQRFAIGRFEITRKEWEAFVRGSGYEERNNPCDWRNPGFSQTQSHPAVCVTWVGARKYVEWIAERTGQPYRLPTKVEWNAINSHDDRTGGWNGGATEGEKRLPLINGSDQWSFTAPVRSFPSGSFGLYDIRGNVWEWLEDCAPAYDCDLHAVAGGGWAGSYEAGLTDYFKAGASRADVGFRIVRELPYDMNNALGTKGHITKEYIVN